MIDKASVYTLIGGNPRLIMFDTPNEDCTDKIKQRVNEFLDLYAGVHDTLVIEVFECED